jgi:hypothetical protein
MHVQIEHHSDLRATPRSLYRGGRRIDIIEIVDQWYGPGYRYVKVRGHDGSVYILWFDEICDHWELIMFCAASAQAWQRKYVLDVTVEEEEQQLDLKAAAPQPSGSSLAGFCAFGLVSG